MVVLQNSRESARERESTSTNNSYILDSICEDPSIKYSPMADEESFDIAICQVSNVDIQNENDKIFYQKATQEAEARRKSGYDINGKPGGQYDENNPPPGKVCGGFLKGNIGIIWKDDSKT